MTKLCQSPRRRRSHQAGGKPSEPVADVTLGEGRQVCVTAIETLMEVTCRFKVIKNTIIESPQAIVPSASPTDAGLTKEMLAKGLRDLQRRRRPEDQRGGGHSQLGGVHDVPRGIFV